MARLSTTGSKKGKGKAAKASKKKAQITKTARRIGLVTKPPKRGSVYDLTRELKEAREQQAATAEILRVINASPGDLTAVFEIILEKTHSLCDVASGSLQLYENGHVRTVAMRGFNERWAQHLREGYKIDDSNRMTFDGVHPRHIPDMRAVPEYLSNPTSRIFVEVGGFRTLLGLPLLRDGKPIGRIVAARKQVRPFTDRQITLLQTFADQAAIAIQNARLFNEVQARTRELQDSLEYQTATSDVLNVISRSPSDIQPVLDAIAETAQRLCCSEHVFIMRLDNGLYHLAAARNATAEHLKFLKENPFAPDRGSITGRAAIERRAIQVNDVLADPEYTKNASGHRGFRTTLGVPLLRDEIPIGVIVLTRSVIQPFSDKQIDLVTTFAEQAVIAINNVQLFDEVQAKTEDLRESLQQQTATADVLKVISASPGQLEPVFKAMLENAVRLCDAKFAMLLLCEKNTNEFAGVASWNVPPAYRESLGKNAILADPKMPLGRAVMTKRPVQVADVLVDQSYIERYPSMVAVAELGGARTLLQVPMLKENELVGTIAIYRQEVRPFTHKQIELVQNFAAQAVIAIENARLLNETKESLERQTATAEILKVIASSPDDVQPVFDAIAASGRHLLGGLAALVTRVVDNQLHVAALTAGTEEGTRAIQALFPAPLSSANSHSMVAATGRPLINNDIPNRPEMSSEGKAAAKAWGFRSLIVVPMLREGATIGTIGVARPEAGEFSTHQIKLLETFADQAVIAIGNVHLFEEVQAKTHALSEALTYQTGSSNILSVIASSPTDVEPVLKAIVESACELCEAYDAVVRLKEGNDLCVRAHHGPIPVDREKWPISRNWTAGRAVLDRQPVDPHDLLSSEGDEFPEAQALAREQGHRTILSVPLLREGESIGAIILRRTEVNPFSHKQIALLQTFADQAVIAIENVRLFNETKEALEQQKAAAEILSVISSSVADTQPVFDKILESCKHLFGGDELDVLLVNEQGQLNIAAYIGESHDIVAATFPAPVERTPAGRAIRERRVMHWPDLVNGEDVPGVLRKMAKLIGYRSMVFAPMLWEDRGIGAIGVARSTGPFKPKELAMLQTFADQAVIAIQNARLFNETKEALERQTATADILNVIASSPDDVQPVFQAIADRSNRLVKGLSTTVFKLVDGTMHLVAFTATNPAADAALKGMFPTPLSAWSWNTALLHGKIYRVPDTETEVERLRDLARLRGYRSMLFVPLLRDGEPIGMIGQTRREPGPFTDHHVQLLQTFADQAVIAISNVALFNEVQERTRELSASLDDLRAAQDRLVQTEKLASLGQLTAGIAHEIKNPLNFVNNFSSLSAELVDELDETLAPAPLDQKMRGDVGELTSMLKSNLEKVVQHGKRADSIVKNMLLHSREGSGEHRSADINSLVEESLNLAYHGARAEKPSFNITLTRDLDPDAGAAELYPQEITRALLNLISNGFYAATRRKSEAGDETFEPILSAVTRNLGNSVEIRIRDNGSGIPLEVKEKMFNPFFTTKPAGEGTGLGLSMSHDIIVKQHGGRIDVETEPGQFTEFIITLPRTAAAHANAGGSH